MLDRDWLDGLIDDERPHGGMMSAKTVNAILDRLRNAILATPEPKMEWFHKTDFGPETWTSEDPYWSIMKYTTIDRRGNEDFYMLFSPQGSLFDTRKTVEEAQNLAAILQHAIDTQGLDVGWKPHRASELPSAPAPCPTNHGTDKTEFGWRGEHTYINGIVHLFHFCPDCGAALDDKGENNG